MSKSEFRKWADSRTPNTPLAPFEPILYFDMKSDQKIEVPCQVRYVQYFKFVPTEFRAEPINYRDVKQFTKYSSEVQFFGIKGVFIDDPTSIEQQPEKQVDQSVSVQVSQIENGLENFNEVKVVKSSETC